jgi:hypothetical protein
MENTGNKSISFHKKQLDIVKRVIDTPTRYVAVCSGRRWGKSYMCTKLALMYLLQGKTVAYYCPAYTYIGDVYNNIKKELSEPNVGVEIVEKNNMKKMMVLSNEASFYGFSTDKNIDAGRGHSFDLVIIDEAALIMDLDYMIKSAVEPTTADCDGKLVIISTPKAKTGDFYRIYQRYTKAFNEGNPLYFTYTGTSLDNTTQDKLLEHVNKLNTISRSGLDKQIYEQEYMAIASDKTGQVFENMKNIVVPSTDDMKIAYWACDIAVKVDFTVCMGFNRNNCVVELQRFQGIDSVDVINNIKNCLHNDRSIPFIFDMTGAGLPVHDILLNEGYNITGYHFSNKSKSELIDQLRCNISNKSVSILHVDGISDVLMQESDNFNYTINDNGNIIYEAAMGQHDDAIISLALGNWLFHKTDVVQNSYTKNDFLDIQPTNRLRY